MIKVMSRSRLPKFVRDTAFKKRGGTAKWLVLKCGVGRIEQMFCQKDEHPRLAIRLVESGVIKQVIHNRQEWESIIPLDVRVTLNSMILPEQPSQKKIL